MDTQLIQNQTGQVSIKWGIKQKFLFAVSQLLPFLIFILISILWGLLGLQSINNGYIPVFLLISPFLLAVVINKLWANYRGFKSWKLVIGWSLLQFPLIYILLFVYTIIISILTVAPPPNT